MSWATFVFLVDSKERASCKCLKGRTLYHAREQTSNAAVEISYEKGTIYLNNEPFIVTGTPKHRLKKYRSYITRNATVNAEYVWDFARDGKTIIARHHLD
jgi:hypothetical protein